jgi:CBS domain-containing protein
MKDVPRRRVERRERPEMHSVGVVRSVGNEGAVARQGFVRCARRESSVPVEECEKCTRAVAVAYGRDGQVGSITCYSEPDPRGERHMRTNLTLPRLSVSDIMTRNVLCVRPDLSLDAVTELFVESGLKAAPVVDDTGKLLGIVSESEVLIDVYARAGTDEREDAYLEDEQLRLVSATRTVADVMVPFAFTLPENAPITRAAAVMAFEGIYRLTVVSEDGNVVGILSAGDILYWLSKADGYALPPPKKVGT